MPNYDELHLVVFSCMCFPAKELELILRVKNWIIWLHMVLHIRRKIQTYIFPRNRFLFVTMWVQSREFELKLGPIKPTIILLSQKITNNESTSPQNKMKQTSEVSIRNHVCIVVTRLIVPVRVPVFCLSAHCQPPAGLGLAPWDQWAGGPHGPRPHWPHGPYGPYGPQALWAPRKSCMHQGPPEQLYGPF